MKREFMYVNVSISRIHLRQGLLNFELPVFVYRPSVYSVHGHVADRRLICIACSIFVHVKAFDKAIL